MVNRMLIIAPPFPVSSRPSLHSLPPLPPCHTLQPLPHSPSPPPASASMVNRVRWAPDPSSPASRLIMSETTLKSAVEVPVPFRMIPRDVIETAGNKLLEQILKDVIETAGNKLLEQILKVTVSDGLQSLAGVEVEGRGEKATLKSPSAAAPALPSLSACSASPPTVAASNPDLRFLSLSLRSVSIPSALSLSPLLVSPCLAPPGTPRCFPSSPYPLTPSLLALPHLSLLSVPSSPQLKKDYEAWASGDTSRKPLGTGEL
ncbi:unnamed protein product [Closterium sp. NIES-65]|nr:unnamed protein product [Closterium sp. NIES-65]